jgi:hypothetical protein
MGGIHERRGERRASCPGDGEAAPRGSAAAVPAIPAVPHRELVPGARLLCSRPIARVVHDPEHRGASGVLHDPTIRRMLLVPTDRREPRIGRGPTRRTSDPNRCIPAPGHRATNPEEELSRLPRFFPQAASSLIVAGSCDTATSGCGGRRPATDDHNHRHVGQKGKRKARTEGV